MAMVTAMVVILFSQGCNCGSQVISVCLEGMLDLLVRLALAQHRSEYIVGAHVWRRNPFWSSGAEARGRSRAFCIFVDQPIDVVTAEITVYLGGRTTL